MLGRLRKKGVASVITWIVAFFIIFFVLVAIYLPSTFFIVGKKLGGKEKPEAKFKEQRKLIETENLISILNTPVEECSFIKTPDQRREWKEAIEKQDFDDYLFINLIKLFVIGEPNKDINREYLFPMGRNYATFNVINNGEYAIYTKLFAECINQFFKDSDMVSRKFEIEFVNGKKLSFWTAGEEAINELKSPAEVSFVLNNKILNIRMSYSSQELFKEEK